MPNLRHAALEAEALLEAQALILRQQVHDAVDPVRNGDTVDHDVVHHVHVGALEHLGEGLDQGEDAGLGQRLLHGVNRLHGHTAAEDLAPQRGSIGQGLGGLLVLLVLQQPPDQLLLGIRPILVQPLLFILVLLG